jgi:hypothetical protein
MLMYTSNDGFLYASNPSTGALMWGWTSVNLLAKMQNYSTFQSIGATNGGFTVVDGVDGAGAWGSYLVGSFQSGAEHFSVKLDSTGTPASVVVDKVNAGGTSPGDVYGAAGSVPMRQSPIVRYDGSKAYYLYVVNVGGVSTLYAVNVATGAAWPATPSGYALGFTASSALYYDAARDTLWLGASDGSVYTLNITDGGYVKTKVFTVKNPVSGAAMGPVLYVGYGEVASVPYAYALTASQLSVFNITTSGWTPLWTATATSGYKYTSGSFVANGSLTTLTSGAVVSDQPLIVGSTLLVPMYIAGSQCEAGRGAYDLFALGSGTFPTDTKLTYRDGTAITGHILLPANTGAALTPSLTSSDSGLVLNPAIPAPPNPPSPQMVYKGKVGPASWRQR